MKKLVLLMIVALGVSLFGATASQEYVKDLKAFLTSKSFSINGLFYSYDFNKNGYIEYNEWVYESVKTHHLYRLLGTEPTKENIFGFQRIAQIDLSNLTPTGYFVFIDFPRDKDRKISWIYLSNISKNVYKLMGADPSTHYFDYLQVDGTQALPNLTFEIEDDHAAIVYRTEEEFNDILGGYDTPGFSWNLLKDGNYLYVADGSKGVEVIEISNPYAPNFLYTLPSYGEAYDIAFDKSRNLLLIADGKKGVTIYDLNFGVVACNLSFDHAEITDIALSPNKKVAYLGAGEKGLYIIDMIDKKRVKLLRHKKGCVCQVQVAQKRLFVGDGSKGLALYDLSHPKRPALIKRVPIANVKSFAIDPSGNYAYIAHWGSSGYTIVDLRTQQTKDIQTLYEIYKPVISLDGSKLYLLNEISTISVWDRSDPLNPTYIKTIYLPYPALDLRFSQDGKLGYVACGGDGVKVITLE